MLEVTVIKYNIINLLFNIKHMNMYIKYDYKNMNVRHE